MKPFAAFARFATVAVFGHALWCASALAAPQPEATWSPAGSLTTPRHLHTATLLSDGRVLVAGGQIDCCQTATDSAEIYDPTTGTWTITGSMKQARAGHSAVRLLDGRVLVVGGTESPDAEIYDPATSGWTRVDGPNTTRFNFTLTLLPSGNVLVAGGAAAFVSAFASAELFDPVTATWRATNSMVEARVAPTATLMSNGKVLVAGGLELTENIELPIELQSAEIYDPSSGTWTKTTSPNRSYLSPTAVALGNGRPLVLGDVGDTEYYDPQTATWTITGTRATGHQGYAAAVLASGDVLVAGGYDAMTTEYVAGTESYDQNSGSWTTLAPLITARSDASATTLANGDVLVVGGLGMVAGKRSLIARAEILRSSTPVAIGPAYTGAWYDPAQSGHGLFVEVLPGNQILVAWFAFAPNGGQAWFYGVGAYAGNTATVSAVDQPSGGRWIPNFDPAAITHNAWGSLKLTFADCNHGRVDFASTLGYGSGSMSLTRLTQPAGLQCP